MVSDRGWRSNANIKLTEVLFALCGREIVASRADGGSRAVHGSRDVGGMRVVDESRGVCAMLIVGGGRCLGV